MKRTLMVLALAAFISSLPLFAAGGADTDAAPAAGVKTKISFTHFYKKDDPNAGAQHKALWTEIDKFRSAHPEIELEIEDLTHDSYEIKMKTLAAANMMPDLYMVKGSWLNSYIANGLISPINDILASDTAWRDNFLPGAFDEFVRNGKDVYGVSWQLYSTHIIFWNAAIFKKAGITAFPKTEKEFVSAIAALRAAGYTPIALGNKGKWVAESCILSTLGDRYTGTRWFKNLRDGKGAKFTDPEFVRALSEFQKLAKLGAFNEDSHSIDHNQQRSLYFNGQAAMFMEGAWAVSVLVNTAPKEVLDVTKLAILPSFEGGKGAANAVSGGSGWAFGINPKASAEKRAAAAALLKAITGSEFAQICIEANGQPSMKTQAYDKTKLAPLSNEYFALMDGKTYTPIYDIQLPAPVIEVMNSGLQELLVGLVTPEKLAAAIQTEYEKK